MFWFLAYKGFLFWNDLGVCYLLRAAGEGGWSFDECDERGNREVKHGIPEPPHRSLFSK